MAPKAVVDGWVEVFSVAGVALDRLEPQQACLLAAMGPQLLESDEDELVIVLQSEAHLCTMVLLRRGEPLFETDFEPRVQLFLDPLQRCLAWYRRRDPAVRSLRLLLSGELPGWSGSRRSSACAPNRSIRAATVPWLCGVSPVGACCHESSECPPP